MKIGFNARFLAHPYSGIGIYTKNVILELARLDRKNEYHIVCHKKQEKTSLKDEKLPENFHFYTLEEIKKGSDSIKKSYWELTQLPRFFKRLGVDIVHSPYPNLASYRSPKHVVTVHDVIPWILAGYASNPLSKLYHRAAKRRTKKADHICTVSEFSKKELQKFLKIPEHKITITPNAVDSSFHKSESVEYKLPTTNYFVYVGGFDKRKNVSQLIDVFTEHIAPHHEVDLVLVGDKLHDTDLYENVEAKIDPSAKGKIHHTGFVTEEEKKEILKNAQALIHLSLYEGFNIPLLEAMHVGTPTLVSDIPPHREVAGDAATYLDVTDEKSMAQAIKTFLQNKDLQSEMSKRGQDRAGDFSWENTAQTLLDLYNQIRPNRDL
jgi:glycosyltransferase involved in cell wall biosynthesis